MSPDRPYKVGMQQNPSFLFLPADPWTNLMSVNVPQGKEGTNVVKPTPASISIETFRIIIQLQHTGWEIQGEHPGVSWGSMVIPGCCSKVTAGKKGLWELFLSSVTIFQQPTWMGVHKSTGTWKVLFLPENPSPHELENSQMAAGWAPCFGLPGWSVPVESSSHSLSMSSTGKKPEKVTFSLWYMRELHGAHF